MNTVRDVHRKVLSANDLNKWPLKDIEDTKGLLVENSKDIDLQIGELRSMPEDTLEMEDYDWECRARDAKRYIERAIVRLNREKSRRRREEFQATTSRLVSLTEADAGLISQAREAMANHRDLVSKVKVGKSLLRRMMEFCEDEGMGLPAGLQKQTEEFLG